MIEALRQAKPVRGRRRTTLAGRSMVPESLRIIHRPEEIAARRVPGHWEGDLVKGAFNRSSVGTLVERKTRFVVLCKMDGNTAEAALEGFTRPMKRLPAALRKSMTYGPRQRVGLSPGAGPPPQDRHLVRRPTRPLTARLEREHQRPLTPVHAQGHGPERCQADLA